MMSTQIQDAEVDLVANLCSTQVTMEQVLGFRPGDFIELELEPLITAKVDGVPVLECQYGVNDGHYALKVGKLLPSSETGLRGGSYGR
jgi:flagellar motor switch protein FliM